MKKRGFTLIEVSLFLAITGLLFIGIAAGVQNSIFQQRINDSVQGFAEFLRSTYSEVTNVQNIGGGKSGRAIYGKLITFNEEETGNEATNVIRSYTVVGEADMVGVKTDKALGMLKELNADVIQRNSDSGAIEPVGIIESFTPRWAASIEPACNGSDCDYSPFTGALLIVRHPKSGIVYTYVTENSVNVMKQMRVLNSAVVVPGGVVREDDSSGEAVDTKVLFGSDYDFRIKTVVFCVNPDPGVVNYLRRDVRIMKGARNASGVEILSDDQSQCNGDN